MRRLVPWALIVLVGLGVGLGAALGAVGSPGPGPAGPSPAQWVAGVLAATKAAGTAQLHYTEVSTSPNPDLRGSATGSGAVDFAAGTFRVSETDHQIEWSTGPGGQIHALPDTFRQGQIAVGPTVYQSFGATFLPEEWSKEAIPRNRSDLGLGSAFDFADTLTPLTAPYAVRSVRDLGPASIDGAATTRYLVQSQLQLECPKPANQPRQPILSTMIWLDGQRRLVQARSSGYSSGKLPAGAVKADPAFADRPMGPSTRVTTLRLSAFGEPVHISAPAVVRRSASVILARLRCAS